MVMENDKENKSGVKVEVVENGPMKITGNFVLKDLKRNIEEAPGEIILCLCGKTATKPYCDGSHEKQNPA
jgi:CDGSH-type Zn-finger protein